MAEQVHYLMEDMVGELRYYEKAHLFDKKEIGFIVKQRRNFEYRLKRRVVKKIDFIRYIDYEMNLERLRQKRARHITTSHPGKGETLKQSRNLGMSPIIRRIHFIFDRAVTKFKGDVDLWRHYVDFAKSTGAKKALSRIYSRCIQLLPTESDFWIDASLWEFEHQNMVSARALMQRSLRLNSEKKDLWLAYFRLELMYIERLKNAKHSLNYLNQKTNMNEMEKIPLISQVIEQNQVASLFNLDETKLKALTEVPNEGFEEFMKDLIPRIVYRNAIRVIPRDFAFRKAFIDIYSSFSYVEEGLDEVFQSMERDFPNDEQVQAYVAKRPLQFISRSSPLFWDVWEQVDQRFTTLCKSLNTTGMWNEYISLYKQELCSKNETEDQEEQEQKTSEPSKTKRLRDLTSKLISIYEEIEKHQALDVDNYLFWTVLVGKIQAKLVLDRAIDVYSDSSILWLKRIEQCHDPCEKETAFLQALEHVQEAEIWFVRKAYIDWMKTQGLKLFHEKLESEFQKASLDKLHGNDGMFAYLHWESERMGPLAALELCLNFFKDRITPQLLREVIDLQKTTSSDDQERHVRELFEAMLRAKDTPSHQQLWLDYISWELRRDHFERAQLLYWRALKLVSNPETFTSQYQALL